MAPSRKPLELPPNFDPEVNMLSREQDGRLFHPSPYSAAFAAELMANGTADDFAVAGRMIESILDCQELDTRDPHYGGFKFQLEEPVVEDINIVQFVLTALIPALVRYQGGLSEATRERAHRAIELGLQEIERIDVGVTYSNVTSEDIVNRCLGGQLLDDPDLAASGLDKLRRWMAFTDESGGVYEYNSASYTKKCVVALSNLAQLTPDAETRVRSKLMLTRIALNGALHIHRPTGRWAGPHGRAYYPTLVGDESDAAGSMAPEIRMYEQWLADGRLPAWILDVLDSHPEEMTVFESTSVREGIGTSSYLKREFALGVATRNLGNQANRYIAWQSNVFTFHYNREPNGPSGSSGSVFSRYILNDEWWGDFEVSPFRKNTGAIVSQPVFPDRGSFCGVQDQERAICLYTPESMGALEAHNSAKAVVAWPGWDPDHDELWFGSERIDDLPAELPEGSTAVVASGDSMLAVRPLKRSLLGPDAPVRAELRDGMLVIEMFNYRGPAKTFWELARPGAFFQGHLQAGFYAEAAKRSDFANPGKLARVIGNGRLHESVGPAFTFEGEGERRWRVEYERNGRKLGIEVDLMDWNRPVNRWTHSGDLEWPMLVSPLARETRSGRVEVGHASLICGPGAAWLVACPSRKRWVAAYHGPAESSLVLNVPGGRVEIPSLAAGLIEWHDRTVIVDAVGTDTAAVVDGGILAGS
ncbi:MAG: hypothetical protein QF357_10795 [Dehalococcoidia bacterium]|jgi:hypothetical protein|nr:hypothetical protein [Dehalococcoidia bacterium]